MQDRDPDAVVQLSGAGDELDVVVWLLDGRQANRRVQSPDGLRAAVEALVVLPASPSPAAPSVYPSYGIAPAAPALPRGPNSEALRIEIGASVVGRSSHSPSYWGLGARAGAAARWRSWLLGLDVRFEPWTRVSAGYLPGFELRTSGLAFLLGRSFQPHPGVLLDGAGTATLLSEAQSVQLSEREVSATEGDVRVGALARCLLGTGVMRWMLSVDAELSPLRVGRQVRSTPELPPRPSWSLGFGMGLAWQEP